VANTLYAMAEDPDTSLASDLLRQARIPFDIIDVREHGILPFLDRDFGAASLPFLITRSEMIEGIESIRAYLHRVA
jgi:hypothetical protein